MTTMTTTTTTKIADLVTLHPEPGFVVKTKILECADSTKVLTKVFINICHDDQVPKPSTEFNPDVVFPLIIENQWEIPIVVSKVKETRDKKGFPSLVYDCCINTRCFTWCQINKDLRLILIEWCIESVETINSLVLERDYSLPKMLSKGELTETEITIQELGDLVHAHASKSTSKIEDLTINEDGDAQVEETLPDLFNRPNLKTKKPLIEEIESAPAPQSHKSPSNDDAKTIINYNVSFKKLKDEYKLCIIFSSDTINYSNFQIRYSQKREAIIIKSLVSKYSFPYGNELEIPVLVDTGFKLEKARCFDCKDKLYIFI
ncbi:hypothetical protein KGF56_000301 [Candida oxycetoniae]|uniref:PIH1 N-terminal domain-containing protein n=1 Tax=Candida oxycetoniae TaxID=497107 RepID=A0AAI9T1S5_9ASCO|nr:uncharacterized protein KGF56_000301 [Candida oxycetoniae]KAI3407008.2 hypothetical protein KGF56_000301 [Candida oxycetoniae]